MPTKLETIDPISGVYFISYQNEEEDPMEADIVEGTTGKRYASTYMGARSRWWDLSWRQAELEQEGIETHNKRINQEIANLEDARSNILQGIPQRADTMARSLMMGNTRRMEWNAQAGPSTTRTWTSGRPGRGDSDRSQPGSYVRNNVANAIRGARTPEQTAAALAQYRRDGQLWEDDESQNKAAFVLMQNRIGNLRDTYINRDGLEYNEAGDRAYADIETLYGSTDATRDLWTRFQTQEGALRTQMTRGSSSVTTREGRDELAEFYNPQTGKLTNNVWEIDPFMYDQESTIDRINAEILGKEAELKDDINLIERARNVNREAFGPSIFESIRGAPERRRQRESVDEAEAAISQYLSIPGNTMESLYAVVNGQPPTEPGAPGTPAEATAAQAPARTEVVRLPNDSTYEYKREGGQWLTRRVGSEDWMDFSGMSSTARLNANERLNQAFPLAPPVEEEPRLNVASAVDIVDSEEVETDVPIDPPYRDIPDPSAHGPVVGELSDEMIEDAAPVPGTTGHIVPGSVRPLPPNPMGPLDVVPPDADGNFRGVPDEGARNQPGSDIEDPDGSAAIGSQAQHNGNVLQAAVGATDLVSRPSQLARRTANAESGTPIAFASTMMENWKGQDPETRGSLQDMISNVATQYNGVNDTKGRNEATEYLLAMYQLEADSGLLTNSNEAISTS